MTIPGKPDKRFTVEGCKKDTGVLQYQRVLYFYSSAKKQSTKSTYVRTDCYML